MIWYLVMTGSVKLPLVISIWIFSDEVVSWLALLATSAHPNPYRGEVTNMTSVVVDCLLRCLTYLAISHPWKLGVDNSCGWRRLVEIWESCNRSNIGIVIPYSRGRRVFSPRGRWGLRLWRMYILRLDVFSGFTNRIDLFYWTFFRFAHLMSLSQFFPS